jgi:hypothetical protein
MTDAEAKLAVADFFYYLDMVEESEEGRLFHPNAITSCRTMDTIAMEKLLKQLKKWATQPA